MLPLFAQAHRPARSPALPAHPSEWLNSLRISTPDNCDHNHGTAWAMRCKLVRAAAARDGKFREAHALLMSIGFRRGPHHLPRGTMHQMLNKQLGCAKEGAGVRVSDMCMETNRRSLSSVALSLVRNLSDCIETLA
ncbi:hypothetical protein M758_1G207600 [Ceratodon purpureus]|nr:hypothetical protein M758_1G207600 [Ceratodon purpureus]